MRILIAHSFYRQAGGEDRYVRQQIELLGRHHEVELLERANADLESRPDAALRMTFSGTELGAARRAVRRFRPDVIHLHNAYPSFGPAVHFAAGRDRIPLVMTVHNFRLRCPNGLMFTEGQACTRCEGGAYWNAVTHDCFPTKSQAGAYAVALAAHRFGFRLERKVDLFAAPSQFMLDRVRSFGIPDDRLTLVRNFADEPAEIPPLGVGGLYLGRLTAEKGVDVLLRALSMAGDPPFEIAGDGPEAADLRRLAATLGLRRLTFLGQVDRDGVDAAVARARTVVVPSVWDETASLSAMEGMAAGRAPVVTDTGGLPELAADRRGLIVPRNDPAALASAIRRISDDPVLAGELGGRALAFARAELSPAAHRGALERAYERVLRDSTARARHATRSGKGREEAPGPELRVTEVAPRPTLPAVRVTHAVSVRPKVLMVHCYYRDLGGENLSFEAETSLLRSRGHDVVLYTRDNRDIEGLDLLGKGRLAARTVWAEDAYGDLAALIRRERPDVVHVQNTFPLISPSVLHAAHRLGIPVVQALRNYRLMCASGILFRDGAPCLDCVGKPIGAPAVIHRCYHDSPSQSGVVVAMQSVHRLLGTWSSAVDLFVAPSSFARSTFIAAGIPADRIVVKPNFVHPDPGPQDAPGEWAVYAGRLAPEKGVMTMLEAWRRSAPLPLRIVGEGPLRPAVEAFVNDHGLAGSVEVLGSRSPAQVLEIMRQARLVLFPSEWYETFGRVAAEAFACGVPVVASRMGAMAEVVEDGRTGLLFTPGDPDDLAATIRRAVDDPQAWARMGRAARAEYERAYTADGNHRRLLEIYGTLVPGLAAGVAAPSA